MTIFSSLHPMLDRVSEHLQDDGIDVSGLFLDHVCYRTETREEYEATKNLFEKYGTILKEEKMIG
jgi:predicted metalloenzyme YecM